MEMQWTIYTTYLSSLSLSNNIRIILIMLIVILLFIFFYKEYKKLNWKHKCGWELPGSTAQPIRILQVYLLPVLTRKSRPVSVYSDFFQLLCGTVVKDGVEGICRVWILWHPLVLLYKYSSIEAILRSSTNIEKAFQYNLLRPWLRDGLVTSSGNKWKMKRKLLTPSFHFRILDSFIPVFNKQSRILLKKLKLMEGGSVDIVSMVTLCTLDIICETAMGVSIGTQTDSESPYAKALQKLGESFTTRLMRPWLWYDFIYNRTSLSKDFQENLQIMSQFTKQVIKERKNELLKTKFQSSGGEFNVTNGTYVKRSQDVFLDLLLYYHSESNAFSEEDIQNEVDNFMFAGHDTTAAGISWTLYLIGQDEHVQEKLHEELYTIFGNDTERPITKDDVRKMSYLERESQRLYPPAPFIARSIKEDIDVNGRTIPVGSTCMIFIYMLHRDPEVFQNPEKFDPDRFLPENSLWRHPFSFIPFSAGPRNCIGQKFAMIEEKIVIANLLRHFRVTSSQPRDKIHLVAQMVLRADQPIKIKFTSKLPKWSSNE
ncbi:cytochrome P450 4V2-like isoform X2 [Tachypleus tridentatus]|uniref:cytochrome P450 4V2-like isoform X2 n=1 Tax=Tachypleus tridentatus TaxID=6853 RepID=UPI003FD5E349